MAGSRATSRTSTMLASAFAVGLAACGSAGSANAAESTASVFQIVQGYPLEFQVSSNDTSMISWTPSEFLDEQTGYSQGTKGIVLTKGDDGQDVVWSLWGDGQSTPNHWWFNVFDMTQGGNATWPAGQVSPCPSDLATCEELSAPLSVAGASHVSTTNFTYDSELRAHIALFAGDTPLLVSLRPTSYNGDACICARDITPSSAAMSTTLMNVYDVAVDTDNHDAYFFGLSDNSHFYVTKYGYVDAKEPEQVLTGDRPDGSPNEAAFFIDSDSELLWLVWAGITDHDNSTALAFNLDDLSKGAVRQIPFDFQVAYFERQSSDVCVVSATTGELYQFDCKDASSLSYVRTVFTHGLLTPPTFLSSATGRAEKVQTSEGPYMYTLVSGDNTTVGQSVRWPVLPQSDDDGQISYAVASLSPTQATFGCLAWPCNDGPFQATQLSQLRDSTNTGSARGVRAEVKEGDTSGAFTLLDVDLQSGEAKVFAKVGPQEKTTYGNWAWDEATNKAWMLSPIADANSDASPATKSFEVAALSRGDTDVKTLFKISVDADPSSDFETFAPVIFSSQQRSSNLLRSVASKTASDTILFVVSSSGANELRITSFDADSGDQLSSKLFNVSSDDVFGDVDINVGLGEVVVRDHKGDTSLIVGASAMVDNRCSATNSIWLLKFPFSASGALRDFEEVSLQCTGTISSAFASGQAQYLADSDTIVFPWQVGPWYSFDMSGSNATQSVPLLTPSRGYEWVVQPN